jgi:beta-lactam-binding protein with PASTA domain
MDRAAQLVIVPDVAGLDVRQAARLAEAAGLALAPPDPDGPPLAALTWPGKHRVVAQRPAPGTVLHRWDSLVVEVTPADDGSAGDREPRRPVPGPLEAQADQPKVRPSPR